MVGCCRLLRSVMLAAVLLVPVACDSAEERAAKHYARGVELAEQGQPEKAILEFRNALSADELHVPSLYGIAEALEAQGDLRGAVGHLNRVIEIEPAHVQARVKLAQAMLLGGALEEAGKHAEAAYAVAPKDPDVLAIRAAVNLRLGNVAPALADANAALAVAPDHPEAGMILIADRVKEGDAGEAMRLADRFLRRNPEHLGLNLVKLQLLGQDPMKQDDFVAHLERMIELFPDERGFHLALARAHRQRGDNAAAIEAIRGLVALDPNNVETVKQLVGFLREVEGDAAARAELEARVAAAGNAEQAFPYHQGLVELDLAAGDREAAEARLERLIEEQDLAGARIALARMRVADKKMDEAQGLIENVLEKDPNNVDALALKAAMEIDAENPDAAVLTLRNALNEEPERLDLLRLAAVAHERTGNAQLAGENLAAAVRVSDYAPEHVLAYVCFLGQRERSEAAATVLDEALRRNPQNRDLLAAAAEIRLALEDWQAAENLAGRLKALDDEESAVLADRITAAARSGQGKLGETIEILEDLTEGAGDQDAAFTQLVRSYVQADEVEKATALVESTLEKNPGNATALLMQGALHQHTGAMDAAEASFRKAIEAAPEAPGPRLALTRLRSGQGDLEGAREIVEAGIEEVPSPADQALLMALAGLQEVQGDIDGAIGTYRTLHEARPDSLVVANNLASLLSDHRADPESLDYAARVARRLGDSSVPQFQDTYGWTLFLKGEHGPALEALRKAVEGLPENAWVQFHIGQTYAALGEAAKAREHLERARELGGEDFPRRADIEATLGQLKSAAGN